VKEQLKGMRKNAKTACGTQTLGNNTNVRTPVAYFRRALFLPFLDNLLEQISTRFNGLSEAALLGLLLIPANLQQLNESSQEKLIQHYSPDLPSQAVRRSIWSCGSASGMLFCVNTIHGLPSL